MSRTTISEARKYDHLYDNVYSTVSAKDFYRDSQRVMYSNVERVPAGRNMFSDVGHYPAYTFRMKANKDIPGFVSQEFRGELPPPATNMVESISGVNRPKYFHKPIVPFLHAVPPEIVLEGESTRAMAPPAPNPLAEAMRKQAEEDGVIVSGGKRTIGSQTMYRDSEAQTDAYTPEYLLSPSEPQPEVLSLTHLTAANFPPSLTELRDIERVRLRKAFETCLPPMTDEASFEVRRRLMEAQEVTQLGYKERAIDEAHAARLEHLQQALETRHAQEEFSRESRVEEVQRRLLDKKDSDVTAIQKRRIQALRKLGKTREMAEARVDMLTGTGGNAALGGRGHKRDIIGDYANYDSAIYAPLTRNGRITDKSKPQLESAVKGSADLLTGGAGGVSGLEATIPLSLTTAKVVKPSLGTTGASVPVLSQTHGKLTGRQTREIAADVARVEAQLLATKMGTTAKLPPQLPAWRVPKEHVTRPPTPTFDDMDAMASDSAKPGWGGGGGVDEDDVSCAVLLLQKLIRGRSVQNIMHEGRTRRADLIAELRAEAEDDVAQAISRRAAEHTSGLLAAVTGEVVSSTLDFLSKELVRLTEHKKIASIVATGVRSRTSCSNSCSGCTRRLPSRLWTSCWTAH